MKTLMCFRKVPNADTNSARFLKEGDLFLYTYPFGSSCNVITMRVKGDRCESIWVHDDRNLKGHEVSADFESFPLSYLKPIEDASLIEWMQTRAKPGVVECDMIINSIFDIVVKFRYSATVTYHEYSKSAAGSPIPCSDHDVAWFIQNLEKGSSQAELIVSDIEWLENGNCDGDELFPVLLRATQLPDKRYFLQLDFISGCEQYIYTPDMEKD